MGLFLNRNGSFSYVRLSILVGVLGFGLLAFGFLTFQLDQQSRREPFFLDLPAGAQQWGIIDQIRADRQRVFYRVEGDDVEGVANYYNQLMERFYSSSGSGERCQRNPSAGAYTNIPDNQRTPNDRLIYRANFDPAREVPFSWRCVFDRGGVNAIQSTEVIIQPGIANDDPIRDSAGYVVIVYDQRWQP